ncbi:MAG: PEP-CTERM sorting domain-containing protein [Tepidisphaeraceae bacterium]
MKLAYALTAAVALVPVVASQAAITVDGSVQANYADLTNPVTSPYTTTGPLNVGNTAAGSVTIDGGSTMTVARGQAGIGGTASINVSGVGSNFTSTSGTYYFGANSASLNLTDGAGANFNSFSAGYGGTSSVNVTNSTLTASSFYASWGGTGTVNINAGGKLITSNFTSFSQGAGYTGTLNIAGTGATWQLNGGGAYAAVRLGYAGDGVINVSNGGSIVATSTVAGANNILFNTSSTGNGTLNLMSGGTIDLGGTSNFTRGTGTGSATFNFTGGTLKNVASFAIPVTQQGGTFTAGSSTSAIGTTALTAGYTLGSAGTLQVDLAGSGGVAGTDFDYYNVTGTASINGYVALLTASGFTPTIGQTFNILTASTIDITGATAGGWGLSVISGGNGQILQATYVPEPASLAIVGLGAVAALARRRSR